MVNWRFTVNSCPFISDLDVQLSCCVFIETGTGKIIKNSGSAVFFHFLFVKNYKNTRNFARYSIFFHEKNLWP